MSQSTLSVLSQPEIEESDPLHALRDERLDAVLDQRRVAMIGELLGHPRHDARALLDLAQQQRTTVRADVSAVELRDHRAPAEAVKFKLSFATLCHRRVALWSVHKRLFALPLCLRRRPFFNPTVRYPG